MRKYNFDNLERISKAAAKQAYKMGFSVLFIPCKLSPVNMWGLGIWENIHMDGQYSNFEKLENAFCAYNCNAETGKYISFYVPTDTRLIHFSFADGSNPYVFRGSMLECMKELKKWARNYNITPVKDGFYVLEVK
jgi:hypothetical protein